MRRMHFNGMASTDQYFRSLTAGLKLKRVVATSTPAALKSFASSIDFFAPQVPGDASQKTTTRTVSTVSGDLTLGKVQSERSKANQKPHSKFPMRDVDSDEEDSDDESGEAETGLSVFGSSGRAPALSASVGQPSRKRARPSQDSKDRLADESMRALRNKLAIKVTGVEVVPDLLQSFEDIPTTLPSSTALSVALERGLLHPSPYSPEEPEVARAVQAVQAAHGAARAAILRVVEDSSYPEPTAIQMQAVPCLLNLGCDVVGVAPTGSGKTAAYVLPLLLRLQGRCKLATSDGTWPGPRALILAPTKELAGQIAREVLRLGAQGAGLKVAVLSHAGMVGAGQGRVAAKELAPELIASRSQPGHRRRQQRGGKHSNRDDELEGERAEGAEDEEEALHWTDDEDLDGVEARSARDAVVSPVLGVGPPGNDISRWVEPALPHCDILVATPLLLVSALRAARCKGAAAHGVPVSSVGACFPRLSCTILDEADRLLGGEDMRQEKKAQTTSSTAAPSSSGFAAQVDEVLAAVRPGKEALRAWWAAHGVCVPVGAGEHAHGQGKRSKKGKDGMVQDTRAEQAAFLSSSLAAHANLALFTATLPGNVREVAGHVTRNAAMVTVGTAGAAATNVDQRLLFVGRENGKLVAMRDLLARGVPTPALVFVATQERADDVARLLRLAGHAIGVLHGGVPDAERELAVRRFRRGEVPWLVATDVAGRGLDYPAVRFVLNVDFPPGPAAYVHRVGRTGRAGRVGEALTMFTEDDVPALRSVASVLKATGCDVPAWMLSLKKASGRDKSAWVKAQGDRRPLLPAGGKGSRKGPGAWVAGAGGRPHKRRRERDDEGEDVAEGEEKDE